MNSFKKSLILTFLVTLARYPNTNSTKIPVENIKRICSLDKLIIQKMFGEREGIPNFSFKNLYSRYSLKLNTPTVYRNIYLYGEYDSNSRDTIYVKQKEAERVLNFYGWEEVKQDSTKTK